MRRLLIPVLFALAPACMGEAQISSTGPSGSASVDMVEVNSGVYAVTNYDEPVFFADNYYWRLYGNEWYRSNWYTGGWARATPPVAVLRVDRPTRYVHYRPHARDRVVIRDNRGRWHRR